MVSEEDRYKSPISGKSALLIRENPIILLPELAIRIGPDLAIIVQQIQYWLEQKEKSHTDRCFIEGRYWVYNTVKDWCMTNFPWWREDQLRRYLETLIETDIVIAKKFEAAAWKQRKWYTLNYETLDKLYQSKIKIVDHKNQAGLINEIKQLAILPKALANSPNQDPDFRQIELGSFAKSSIYTETTSKITSETTISCAEGDNDNRSQINPNQVAEQTQDDQKEGVASHSKTLKSQYEKEFEDLVWPIAYNKKAKAKAMSSYCTVRKEVMKTDEQRDDLLEAWRYVNEVVYPAKHKKDGTKQFIPMPTTWFNQHRWNDEDIQEGIHNRFITGDSTPSIDINSLSKEQRAEYERKSNLMAFYAKQQQKNGGTAA